MAKAMAKATGKEHVLLAVMAGQSSVDDHTAAPIGARIETGARRCHQHRVTVPAAHVEQPSLLERLKAVVAA
jgi:hypothetical protein